MYQWKQDIGAAERCCNEALRIDPECEAAVATLAQLNLQQSRIEKAVEMFGRQVELARSEIELANVLTYQYVRFLFVLCFFWVEADLVFDFLVGFEVAVGVYEELSGDGGRVEPYCEGDALSWLIR
jgi:tetratricopeptide (TPR) repeat protein